jgi:hypothetical protein
MSTISEVLHAGHNHRAAQRHQAVADSVSPMMMAVSVLMPCARTMLLVIAGGADGAAQFGAEKPVHQRASPKDITIA